MSELIGNCHFNKIFEVKNFLTDEECKVVLGCMQDKDTALHFPEDAAARTIDEVNDALNTAHKTVDLLIDIIKDARTTMCNLCKQNAQMKADASWILNDEPHTPCRECPWKEITKDAVCI
jgi:hypothetical protein